jgi:hypothetical protein
VEVRAAKAVKAAVVETEAVEVKAAKRRDALEVAACIGSIGIHWKCTEVDGADGAGSEDKVLEAVKQSELVRTR